MTDSQGVWGHMGRARLARNERGESGRGGMTLLEVVVAMSILVIAMVGFSRAIGGSLVTTDVDSEGTLATESARRMVETLRAATFEQVFARYNAVTGDDPPLGESPGSSFAVAGLQAVEGDADGMVGQILFPVQAGAPLVLREDGSNMALGTPRDLDGDGAIDDQDHAGDYRILPVLIRLQWRGSSGPARLELRTLLSPF